MQSRKEKGLDCKEGFQAVLYDMHCSVYHLFVTVFCMYDTTHCTIPPDLKNNFHFFFTDPHIIVI